MDRAIPEGPGTTRIPPPIVNNDLTDDAALRERPWLGKARPLASTRVQAYRKAWLLLMGKEKGFALTSIRAREMRRFLEREGYVVEPGQHKHLKLRHQQLGDVLLPLRPSDNLSHVALKQIAKAMGLTPEELTRRVK